MSSVIVQGIDFAELRAEIVADVVTAMQPLLDASSGPMLVDGDRMAELAGVSRPTIDRLVRREVIPSVMIGRRRLYCPSMVINALIGAASPSKSEKRDKSGFSEIGGT